MCVWMMLDVSCERRYNRYMSIRLVCAIYIVSSSMMSIIVSTYL